MEAIKVVTSLLSGESERTLIDAGAQSGNTKASNADAELFILWNAEVHPVLPDDSVKVFTRVTGSALVVEQIHSLTHVVGSNTATSMLIESIYLVLSWLQIPEEGYEIKKESGTLITESWLLDDFSKYLTRRGYVLDKENRAFLMKAVTSLVFRDGDPTEGITIEVLAARVHREIEHYQDFVLFVTETKAVVDTYRKRFPPFPKPTAFSRKVLRNISVIVQEFMLSRHPDVHMMSLHPACLGVRDYENKITVADAFPYQRTEMCCFVVQADVRPTGGVIKVDVIAFGIDPRCFLTLDAMMKLEHGITSVIGDVMEEYITNVLGHAMDGYLLKNSYEVYYSNQFSEAAYTDEPKFLFKRAPTLNVTPDADKRTVRERSRQIIEPIIGESYASKLSKYTSKKKSSLKKNPAPQMTAEELEAAAAAAEAAEKELLAMLDRDDKKTACAASGKAEKKKSASGKAEKKKKSPQVKKPEGEIVFTSEDAAARLEVLSISENRKALESAPSPKVYKERLQQMILQHKTAALVDNAVAPTSLVDDPVSPFPVNDTIASTTSLDPDESPIAFTRVGMLRDQFQFHGGDNLGGVVDEAFVDDMCIFSENDMMILELLRCKCSTTSQKRSERHDQNLEEIVKYVTSMQDIDALRKYLVFREMHFEVFEYLLVNADSEPLINFLFCS